jgi:hypothetical protein
MAKKKRQRVLRVVVVADDRVIEDLHQTKPGDLDVGQGSANDVHVYDEHLTARDFRKHAPLQLGAGALMVVAGAILFARDVLSHGRLVAEAEAAGEVLTSIQAAAMVDGFSYWPLLALFAGMVPLISGFTALRMEPPPVIERPKKRGKPVPESHRLFRWDTNAQRYELDIPGDAGGVVVLGKKKLKISALRKQRGDSTGRVRLTLPPKAKGKLLLGRSTLVFQMTKPARGLGHLAFPTALIDNWQYLRTTRLDMGVQLSAAVLLGGFFMYLTSIEATEPEASDRFLTAMDIVRYVPEDEPEEEPEEEAEEEVLEVEDKETEKDVEVEPEDTKVLDKKPEKFSKQAVEKARGVGINRVLGTYGGEGEGTVLDVIASTENNLGELFAMGMTQTVNADGTDISAFVAGGEGISAHGAVVDTEGLATTDGPADVGATAKKERKVKSRVKSTTDEVYGDVDKKMVKAVIRRRMGGLKACYEKELRAKPNLSGRMSFSIEVAVIGRVTRVSVDTDTVGDPKVASCVKAKIKSWRFPVEDAEEPAEVTFSVVFES